MSKLILAVDCMHIHEYAQNPRRRIKLVRLPKNVYDQAMQSFIVVCTDVVFVNRKRKTIFLAYRNAKPASNQWWYVGGRRFAGEDPFESIQRCVKRETTLTLKTKRFRFVRFQEFYWNKRKQPLKHDFDFVFSAELNERELKTAAKNLDPEEYKSERGFREFSKKDLIAERVHPAIIDTYNQIF